MSGAAATLDSMIVVANKADLVAAEGRGDESLDLLATAAQCAALPKSAEALVEGAEGEGGGGRGGAREGRVWKVSCKTKEGIDGFMEHLEAEVVARFQGGADDESPLITR